MFYVEKLSSFLRRHFLQNSPFFFPATSATSQIDDGGFGGTAGYKDGNHQNSFAFLSTLLFMAVLSTLCPWCVHMPTLLPPLLMMMMSYCVAFAFFEIERADLLCLEQRHLEPPSIRQSPGCKRNRPKPPGLIMPTILIKDIFDSSSQVGWLTPHK
jgi:hypothetical protein